MPLSATAQNDLLGEEIDTSDLPSLKALIEYGGDQNGRMTIDGKQVDYSLVKSFENDKFVASLETTGEYMGDPEAVFTFTVTVDEKGNIVEGNITKEYSLDPGDKRSTAGYKKDVEPLDTGRAKQIIAQFKPLAAEMKEKQEGLPKIPDKMSIFGVGLDNMIHDLSRKELEDTDTILLNPKDELPDSCPIPLRGDVKIYTGKCTVLVGKHTSWGPVGRGGVSLDKGALLVWFPDLESGRDSDSKSELNRYKDALVFPYTGNNHTEIAGHWDRIYGMIKEGMTSENIHKAMKRIAKDVEDKYTNEKNRYVA